LYVYIVAIVILYLRRIYDDVITFMVLTVSCHYEWCCLA